MANNLRVLTGNWYDEDGFLIEQSVRFLVFPMAGGKFEDDMHLVWTPDDEGNLVSDQCVAYFLPDEGELARVGLAQVGHD